uniref:Uncharacterized protein n=1 Tax=Arundo donax TaxID=35708 RepID=A0A0A9AVX2_ARUDO
MTNMVQEHISPRTIYWIFTYEIIISPRTVYWIFTYEIIAYAKVMHLINCNLNAKLYFFTIE